MVTHLPVVDLNDYPDPVYSRGLYLPHLDLWLDARKPQPVSVVSHAHSDHTAQHDTIIATPETAILAQFRRGAMEVIELSYGQPWQAPDGRFTLTLQPAGHTLGSAQTIIDEPNGRRTVYTGDFKLRDPLHGPPAPIIPCHVLIMEATFGKPGYVFPPDEAQVERLYRLCHAALAEGAVPVVFGYAIGKAQMALTLLLQGRFEVLAHGSVDNIAALYRESGVRFPGTWERYTAGRDHLAGKVLVAPTNTVKSRMIQNLTPRKLVYLSGWGMDANARWRLGVDEVIPLSDHADWTDLNRYVAEAQPQRVYTVHGFPDLARHLRREGFDAQHLETHQLELF